MDLALRSVFPSCEHIAEELLARDRIAAYFGGSDIITWPEQPGARPRGLHRSFRPKWTRRRVICTSNAYVFTDPAASKSKSQAGTKSDIKSIHAKLLSSG